MSNPIDAYFMAKESGFWGGFTSPYQAENLGKTVGSAVLATGVGAALASAPVAARAVMGAITKRRDYNLMMEHNPDLHEMKAQNPVMFNQMYSSLRSSNPAYGSDPIIAGAHMRQMVDNPASAGLVLAEGMRNYKPRTDVSFGAKSPDVDDRHWSMSASVKG